MNYETLLIDTTDNIRTITINRPKALNALNPTVLSELGAAVTDVAHDESVRCLILTGAGEKAFVAGADIAAMEGMIAVEARQFARVGQAVMHAIEELPIPVIAAVNGFALGGGLELAMACDLIVASANARFGQPEINLGIIPGFGGTQRLPRRVGAGAARRLIYGGAMIGTDEALRLGLVDQTCEPGQLMAETLDLARSLASKAPIAIRQAKAAINVGFDVDLADGCRFEAEAFGVTFATDDRREGMRAFLEKRTARFSGR